MREGCTGLSRPRLPAPASVDTSSAWRAFCGHLPCDLPPPAGPCPPKRPVLLRTERAPCWPHPADHRVAARAPWPWAPGRGAGVPSWV